MLNETFEKMTLVLLRPMKSRRGTTGTVLRNWGWKYWAFAAAGWMR